MWHKIFHAHPGLIKKIAKFVTGLGDRKSQLATLFYPTNKGSEKSRYSEIIYKKGHIPHRF